MLNTTIKVYIKQVTAACPEIKSIWLIGSRANGTAAEESDWDFIAFGNAETYERLQLATELHRADVDFMVLTNGDEFRTAWDPDEKGGSLSEWQWTETSEFSGHYMQTKDRPGNSNYSDCTIKNAFRVWPSVTLLEHPTATNWGSDC